MPFKEGTEAEHVHAFRGVVAKARALDEAIDGEQLTPHEALEELLAHMKGFPAKSKPAKEAK